MSSFREMQAQHKMLGDKVRVLDSLLQYLRLFPDPDTGEVAEGEFEFTDLNVPSKISPDALVSVMEDLYALVQDCYQRQNEIETTPLGKGPPRGQEQQKRPPRRSKRSAG